MTQQDEIHYLAVADVLALHNFLMERTGWASAPCNEALLEGAVWRPQHAAYYGGANLWEQAAILATGIVQARAFVDGNKRTAFIACLSFLTRNGHPFPEVEALRQALAERLVAIGAVDLSDAAGRTGELERLTAELAAWLREQTRQTR
jgi:death-on-curing family protein